MYNIVMDDNQLAKLISSLDKRFDGIDKRFDGIDKRFDGIDKRLDGIDKRFDGIDKRLDGMDKRFDGVDKTFVKMFKYTSERFDSIDEKLNGKADKTDVERLINTMDDFIRRVTNNETEQAARDAQFARLVEWAREVSKKTGVPLPNL